MSFDTAVSAHALRPERARTVWATHLTILALLLVLLGAAFWPAIVAAVRVWWVSPTYSHCFIIIPISGFLIWQRRARLKALRPRAYAPALLLTLPLLALLLLAALADVNEAEQLALVAMGECVALAVLGPAVYRAVLFPALYLLFLVPVGGYLVTPLQHFTTHFVSAGLSLIGILHYTEGNILQLPTGSFEVAEACAGLRFLIATIAVGTLFCYFTYRRWYKIALFLIACAIVPVIGNGLRALLIVLLGYYSDMRVATGADHLIYGWGFSVAILLLLMGVGMRFADPVPEAGGAAALPPSRRLPPPRRDLALTAAMAALAIFAVPAFLYWHDHRAPAPNEAAFSAPIAVPGFVPRAVSDAWHPLFGGADARLAYALVPKDGGPAVSVFTDFYSAGSHGRLVTSTNKMWDEDVWHDVTQGTRRVDVNGRPMVFNTLVIASITGERLVWWSYWSGGRFTRDPLAVKLDRLRTAFDGGGGAALVALSTPLIGNRAAAAARLGQVLRGLAEPLTQRLAGAGGKR